MASDSLLPDRPRTDHTARRLLLGSRVHTPAYLSRSDPWSGRAPDIPADGRRRASWNALDRVRRSAAPLQRRLDGRTVCDAAPAVLPAVQPAGLQWRAA